MAYAYHVVTTKNMCHHDVIPFGCQRLLKVASFADTSVRFYGAQDY